MEAKAAARPATGGLPLWALGAIPLALIAIALGLFAVLGGPGLGDRAGPPVEDLAVERTVLRPGEIDLPTFTPRGQPSGLLGGRHVTSERNLRRVGRHVADRIADGELADQPGDGFVRRQGEHRRGCVEHFGETAARSPADCRQRIGEPRRGDQMIR